MANNLKGDERIVAIIDLIILAIVMKQPSSAYDIQKLLKSQNLTRFIKISISSVYKKAVWLEAQGYLNGKAKKTGKLPEKAVYTITAEGEKYYLKLLESASEQPLNIFLDLNAVFMNLDSIPYEKQNQILNNICTSIRDLKVLVELNISNKASIPLSSQCILNQQLLLVTALEEWVVDLPNYSDNV